MDELRYTLLDFGIQVVFRAKWTEVEERNVVSRQDLGRWETELGREFLKVQTLAQCVGRITGVFIRRCRVYGNDLGEG